MRTAVVATVPFSKTASSIVEREKVQPRLRLSVVPVFEQSGVALGVGPRLVVLHPAVGEGARIGARAQPDERGRAPVAVVGIGVVAERLDELRAAEERVAGEVGEDGPDGDAAHGLLARHPLRIGQDGIPRVDAHAFGEALRQQDVAGLGERLQVALDSAERAERRHRGREEALVDVEALEVVVVHLCPDVLRVAVGHHRADGLDLGTLAGGLPGHGARRQIGVAAADPERRDEQNAVGIGDCPVVGEVVDHLRGDDVTGGQRQRQPCDVEHGGRAVAPEHREEVLEGDFHRWGPSIVSG